jgi:hypothetical protein
LRRAAERLRLADLRATAVFEARFDLRSAAERAFAEAEVVRVAVFAVVRGDFAPAVFAGWSGARPRS